MLLTVWYAWSLGAISEVFIWAVKYQCSGSWWDRANVWRWRLAHWSCRRRSTRCLLPSHYDMRQWWSWPDWLAPTRRRRFVFYMSLDCHLALYVLLKNGITTRLFFCLPTLVIFLLTSTTNQISSLLYKSVLSSLSLGMLNTHVHHFNGYFTLKFRLAGHSFLCHVFSTSADWKFSYPVYHHPTISSFSCSSEQPPLLSQTAGPPEKKWPSMHDVIDIIKFQLDRTKLQWNNLKFSWQ